VIGTRETPDVEHQRIERLVEWGRETRAARNRLVRLLRRVDVGLRPASTARSAASFAVNALGRRNDSNHRRALALVEELCAMGTAQRLAVPPRSSRGGGLAARVR
jgi:hypothetical protein